MAPEGTRRHQKAPEGTKKAPRRHQKARPQKAPESPRRLQKAPESPSKCCILQGSARCGDSPWPSSLVFAWVWAGVRRRCGPLMVKEAVAQSTVLLQEEDWPTWLVEPVRSQDPCPKTDNVAKRTRRVISKRVVMQRDLWLGLRAKKANTKRVTTWTA
jgi:hypothetical protein